MSYMVEPGFLLSIIFGIYSGITQTPARGPDVDPNPTPRPHFTTNIPGTMPRLRRADRASVWVPGVRTVRVGAVRVTGR